MEEILFMAGQLNVDNGVGGGADAVGGSSGGDGVDLERAAPMSQKQESTAHQKKQTCGNCPIKHSWRENRLFDRGGVHSAPRLALQGYGLRHTTERLQIFIALRKP